MNSKLILIILLCVALTAIAHKVSHSDEAKFEKFIHDFDRHYSSHGERHIRFLNFKKTLERIKKENRHNGASFGITKFADWSEEEFRARNLVPFTPEDFARTCLMPNVTRAETLTKEDLHKIGKPVPLNFDWRTKGVVTSVKNQGNCGSCWTFSTAGNIESQYAIAGNPLTDLSEQMIVDCSHGCVLEEGMQVCNSGCEGGWMWTAMTDIMSWGGLETEDDYPYTGEDGGCQYNNDTKDLIATISNYTCIPHDEEQMLLQLLKLGPLSIAMDAGLLMDYSSGIIIPENGDCYNGQLDHAILIVGYGVANSTDFWIVKNSWGSDWGEDGYFRIIRGTNACGLSEAVVCATLAD